MSGISPPSPGYMSRFVLAISPNVLTLLAPGVAFLLLANVYADRFLGLLSLCVGLTLVVAVSVVKLLAGLRKYRDAKSFTTDTATTSVNPTQSESSPRN